ncbi:MAG: LamG-like jellyroll fold domain-containing protein [Eubacteriales bacterium]
MKKTLSILLTGVLCMSMLASCGGTPEDTSVTTAGKTSATTTASTTTTLVVTDPPKTDDTPDIPENFTPSDLSNLLIWYDASALNLSDGAAVERMENLASKDGSYPAVAVDAQNAPVFAAASDISGKAGLVLGKQSSLKVEGSENLDFDDFTIITVVRANSVADNSDQNQIFSKLAVGGNWDHQWYFNINGASRFNAGWKDTTGTYMDFGSSAADLAVNTDYILASSKQGNTSQLYINGVNIGSLNSSVNTVAKNSEAIYIGSNGTTSQSMDGTVCEILLLTGEVTDTEMNALMSYLAEKWSISIG